MLDIINFFNSEIFKNYLIKAKIVLLLALMLFSLMYWFKNRKNSIFKDIEKRTIVINRMRIAYMYSMIFLEILGQNTIMVFVLCMAEILYSKARIKIYQKNADFYEKMYDTQLKINKEIYSIMEEESKSRSN